MTRYVQTLLTTAFLFACGLGASAQPNLGTLQPQAQPQQQAPSPGPDLRERSMMGDGVMGRGMGYGIMRRWMMRNGSMGPGGMMSPLSMRLMFALMDADGDGTVSLPEFQTAHERIFKAMDANKDGVLTLEEIQDFMRGSSAPAPQPSAPTPQRP